MVMCDGLTTPPKCSLVSSPSLSTPPTSTSTDPRSSSSGSDSEKVAKLGTSLMPELKMKSLRGVKRNLFETNAKRLVLENKALKKKQHHKNRQNLEALNESGSLMSLLELPGLVPLNVDKYHRSRRQLIHGWW